ncbi:hypothetical protein, partial [Marinobacter sp. MBR-105]
MAVEYIERAGEVSLKLVDGAYTVENSADDVTLKRPNGSDFREDPNYQFVHAEPTSDGGYVAVMQFSDGQVSLRWFSATGNMVDLTPNASLSSYIEREAELNIDLDGDGVLTGAGPVETVIESEGAATLKVVEGAYTVETSAGDVTLKRPNGSDFREDPNYQFVHAEPTSDGGYVAVMQFSDGQV